MIALFHTNLKLVSCTNLKLDAVFLLPFNVQGIRTPDIAAWQRLPQAPDTFASRPREGVMYPRLLRVYNQPQYDRMFLRDRKSGEYVHL